MHSGTRGRVAIVRHGLYPEQPHLRRDVMALRSAGFEVDVICDMDRGKRHFERLSGVTVIRLPLEHRRSGMARYLFEYGALPVLAAGALALRSALHRYDFVEIDTMPDWLVAAAVIPKALGARIVLYMFENMAELLATDHDLSHSHPLVRLLDEIELLSARFADDVMTPYEKARQRLIEQGIPATKVRFIANGPDEDVFLSRIGDVEKFRAGVRSTDGFKLVTHGSLLERYGIQTLIEAVSLLRDRIPGLTLEVIGVGEYQPELEEQVRKLSLTDAVTFNGPVHFVDMAGRLLRADVGVVPLWIDGMPNKLMEYLLLGIPAVVSDFPSLRRHFGDEEVLYVPAKDAEALAAAIEELYRDPAKRESLATAGRRSYLETLAWSKARNEYLSVYRVTSDSPADHPRYQSSSMAESRTEPGVVGDQAHGGFRTMAGGGSWLSFVLGQSRGPRNALTRLPTILNRFGMTPRKTAKDLEVLLEVTDRYGVHPTLPVTAVTARRNPEIIRHLQDRGVEVAAHGYVHNDYASLPRERQFEQVKLARSQLEELGFYIQGWRCPYSRWNDDTLDALKATGFKYDATPVYEWDAFSREDIPMSLEARADYERLCALFNVRDASKHAVLPWTRDGLLQIPMSIPQDEDMVDRLHLDEATMSRVWTRVLQDSREAGEAFVICLHPERARLCRQPLDDTLSQARAYGDVWLAGLGEIAAWWERRRSSRVTVEPDGEGRWSIATEGPPDVATRLASVEITGSGAASVEQQRKPAIACGPVWSDESVSRLREAGFLVDQADHSNGSHAVRLEDVADPGMEPDAIVRRLQPWESILVRTAPWPKRFVSCLSVTGDIDALTLFDFAMRLKEF